MKAKTKVTFAQTKKFISKLYKPSRLYGRNKSTGWSDDYGDIIVAGYVEQLNNGEPAFVGMHESNTGEPVKFTAKDVITASKK